MIRVVEAFSGIGSQAKALEILAEENSKEYQYEIVKTIEWDVNSIVAYDIIHNGPQDLKKYKHLSEDELVEILFNHSITTNGKTLTTRRSLKSYTLKSLQAMVSAIDRTKNLGSIQNIEAKDLPEDIDVLTYSFPCQDLSLSGYFHGDKGGINRNANNNSSMLWEVERILFELRDKKRALPKILLMENVTSIRSKKHIKNFEEWIQILRDLGYESKPFNLCAQDFDIPQTRKRTFMISIYHGHNENLSEQIKRIFEETPLFNEEVLNQNTNKTLKDFLKLDYNNETYRQEAIEQVPNNTDSRKEILEKNPIIVDENGNFNFSAIRTITTKQDRHPNSGLIMISKKKLNLPKNKATFRYITPREAFLLMGFHEDDFDLLLENNFLTNIRYPFFTNDKLTKMAGNSIVVNVLVEIFRQVFEIYHALYR